MFIEGGLYLHILSLNLRPIILELYGSFIDGKFLKWPYGAELVKISNFGNFYFFKFFFFEGLPVLVEGDGCAMAQWQNGKWQVWMVSQAAKQFSIVSSVKSITTGSTGLPFSETSPLLIHLLYSELLTSSCIQQICHLLPSLFFLDHVAAELADMLLI